MGAFGTVTKTGDLPRVFPTVREALDSARQAGAVVYYAPNYDIYLRVDHKRELVYHLVIDALAPEGGRWVWQAMKEAQ